MTNAHFSDGIGFSVVKSATMPRACAPESVRLQPRRSGVSPEISFMQLFKVPRIDFWPACSAQPQKSVPSNWISSLIRCSISLVDQFDDGGRRSVSAALSGFGYPGVAAGAFLVGRPYHVEKVLDQVF